MPSRVPFGMATGRRSRSGSLSCPRARGRLPPRTGIPPEPGGPIFSGRTSGRFLSHPAIQRAIRPCGSPLSRHIWCAYICAPGKRGPVARRSRNRLAEAETTLHVGELGRRSVAVCKTAGSAYAGSSPASPIRAELGRVGTHRGLFAAHGRLFGGIGSLDRRQSPLRARFSAPVPLSEAYSQSQHSRKRAPRDFHFGPSRANCVGHGKRPETARSAGGHRPAPSEEVRESRGGRLRLQAFLPGPGLVAAGSQADPQDLPDARRRARMARRGEGRPERGHDACADAHDARRSEQVAVRIDAPCSLCVSPSMPPP